MEWRGLRKNGWKALLIFALSGGCSIAMSLLGVDKESIIMVFLLGVLFTTVLTSSYVCGILVSLGSVMLFNFLFTEPRFTFAIYSTNDVILLAFFLVTAVVSGTVTSRLQQQMELSAANERTARTLYKVASAFLSASGRKNIVLRAVSLVREYAGCACVVALDGDVILYTDGTEAPAGEAGVYPVESAAGRLGELRAYGPKDDRAELIIRAVATQLGIALDREFLSDEREKIGIAMERERQRGTLLRSVAHDLRSPLTALSGAGNLLADSYEALTDAERKKLAADMSEEITWLTGLVENILNMTRISESQLILHREDEVVDDVVSEAIAHTERLMRKRRFTVSLPDEVVVAPMDGRLIVQVIINLLENAVRHTPPESEIALAVTAEPGGVEVSVADTGEGVDPRIREKMFDRFVTLEREVADGKRGLGLGLSICKTIVEAHGGTIRAVPNEPKGTKFIFTLPTGEKTDGK